MLSLPRLALALVAAPLLSFSLPLLALPGASAPAASDGLAETMLRVGLSPEALATSGCTATDASAAVSDLDDHLAESGGAIASADSAWADANAAVQTLKRKIQVNQATQAEIDSLAGLEATLAAAQSTLQGLLDGAFEAATDSFSQSEVDTLLSIKSNGSWGIPTHFLVVDRTEASWVALRDALAEERIAAKYDESVSAESQALISAALADSDVATAKTNLDTNLASVAAAWESATNG